MFLDFFKKTLLKKDKENAGSPGESRPKKSRRRGRNSRKRRRIRKEVNGVVASVDLAKAGGDVHKVTVFRWPGREAQRILAESYGITCVQREEIVNVVNGYREKNLIVMKQGE